MNEHKFAVGDRVSVLPDRSNANVRPGIYVVTRRLPVTGQRCQYRVKSALDTHERVLDEDQMRAVTS
jgi:hypothetical protein